MAGPTRSRDERISSFAGSLFAAMLSEIVMDAALQAHRDVARSKDACEVCGVHCGSVHAQANNAGASKTVLPVTGSPSTATKLVTEVTPITKDKSDGNIYFECTNCQKKIASNRYAPHLSGCLGIGTGSRRGAARNAAAKNKVGVEPDRAVSPTVSSDYGSPSEGVNDKAKGKGKNGKKVNGKAVEPTANGNQKRMMTPDAPPVRKPKKQKTPIVSEHQLASDSHIRTSSKRPPKNGTTASPYAPASPSAVTISPQYSGNDSPTASGSVSSLNARSPKLINGQRVPTGSELTSPSSKQRGRPLGSGKNQFTIAVAGISKRKMRENKGEDLDFVDVDGEDREESSSDST